MDSKDILASNLNWYMSINGKSRKEVSEAIGVSYFTFTDWVKGKKYPRMDKIEKLAKYFRISISDLIEERLTDDKEKENDIAADIVDRMLDDSEFLSLVKSLSELDKNKISAIKLMLDNFL